MRPSQCTLRAGTVHAHARRLLQQHLRLADFQRSVPATLLAAVLLLAACWQTSLSAVCSLLRHAPSHETVRKALLANLPTRPLDLRRRLLAALRDTLPEHLGASAQPMAVDLHQRPYYGRFTTGCTRRQKKKSTRRSFTYATLAVLAPTGRFTVGLLLTRPFMRLTTILQELLDQAREADLTLRYLMLDKEFYSAEVIDLLHRHDIAFVMPAKQRGRRVGEGNRHLFAATTPVGWHDYQWTAPLRRRDFQAGKRSKRGSLTVRVAMCVARHQRTGKRLVFACGGINWAPVAVVRAYRRRFGIESKYRQLGQCLAATCSRDERVRVLLVGVALLLCNLWAWLHAQVFGVGALGERELRLRSLRLGALTRALVQSLLGQLGGMVLEWQTQRPLPAILAHVQEP